MTPKIAVLIPLYNHAKTIAEVVRRSQKFVKDVFVFDDGSTDLLPNDLANLAVKVFQHEKNQGKGAAILAGAKNLANLGYTHMITLDADLQHYPEELPKMLQAILDHPKAFIVGARDFTVPNVPKSSKFGRSFASFWVFVHTGQKVTDPQSGYRVYPLDALLSLNLHEKSYAFEIEVLVRSLWAGYEVFEVPIKVFYPKKGERISHFKAIRDNLRITLLNTKLTIRAMTPIPFARHDQEIGPISLKHPIAALQKLTSQSSAKKLALSAAIAIYLITLPLFGLQCILILWAIHLFNLDRLCTLSLVPLSWCPIIPAACFFLGTYVRNGQFLTEYSLQTLAYEAHQRFFEWLLGAMILAPILAVIFGLIVYIASKSLKGSTV